MDWAPFPLDPHRGGAGSEGGAILADEEYDLCARITLEREARIAPFAITCGVYGWMVHTRFFSDEANARAEYAAMRAALARIVELIPLADDPGQGVKTQDALAAISAFLASYP